MVQAVQKVIINLALWTLIFNTAEGYNISDRLSPERPVRHRRTVEAPETLSIKYHHDDEVKEVIFKRVMNTIPSFLVPIWKIEEEASESYIIEDIDTVCYHGVNSYSAMTYFSHTGTLHGVLDYEFFIDYLPLTNAGHPNLVRHFIHPMSDSPISGLPHQNLLRNKRMIKGAGTDNKPRWLSHKKSGKTLYPEILLVVDTTTRIAYDHYEEKIVIYALAYWNAVDMLFSHLKRTEIKINIAGIVLGSTEDVMDYIRPPGSTVDEASQYYMMNEVALDALGSTFYHGPIQVERDSFDFLIWMTEASLLTPHGRNRGGPELGIAAPPSACGGTRDEEKRTGKISNRAVIMHDSKYTNYQTAARELAYMMFVSIDDLRQPDSSSKGPSRGIMDPSNKRVEGCLRWSYRSEVDFSKYSSSTSSCCLLNFPYRTMGEPKPAPPPLTVDDQCQCYKMEAHEQVHHNNDICKSPFQCKNQRGQFIDVGYPLDGTLCRSYGNTGYCRHNECLLNSISKSDNDQDDSDFEMPF